jgi:hypothetical protein
MTNQNPLDHFERTTLEVSVDDGTVFRLPGWRYGPLALVNGPGSLRFLWVLIDLPSGRVISPHIFVWDKIENAAAAVLELSTVTNSWTAQIVSGVKFSDEQWSKIEEIVLRTESLIDLINLQGRKCPPDTIRPNLNGYNPKDFQ